MAKKLPVTAEHSKQENEESGFFEAYSSFAKTLRNWLIIYGIAVPALFVQEERFSSRLGSSPECNMILALFLFGVLLQLLEVFAYKITMGYLYLGEIDRNFRTNLRYFVSEWFSEQTWPVVLFDGGTIVAFGFATWKLLHVFTVPG